MATSDRWIDSPRRPLLVSRRHGMLTYHADADTWVLEDLKSINGIFVNGKKVGRTRSPPSTPSTSSCSPS
jgi:pSer/pThr/pTyr-binding forkhead associated (FHA) protein